MKKVIGKIKWLLLTVAVIAMCVPFVGCTTPQKAKGEVLGSVGDVYAFSAMSTAQLLSQMTAPAAKTNVVNAKQGGEAQDVLEQNIERVNQYLIMFEGMLAKNPIDSKVETNVEYDGVLYGTKMTISVINIDLTSSEFIFYFNEVATDENGDAKLDEDGNEVEVDEDDRETETNSSLEGVMVMGETIYSVTGEKKFSSETEDGETETESEIEFIAADENGNKVKVIQETEEEEGELEQVFKYSFMDKDNKIISSSKLDFEQEEDEVSLKLHLQEKGVNSVYKFEREGNEIKIHYSGTDAKTVNAKVTVVENEDGTTSFEYEFASGKKQQHDRRRGDK